MDTQTQPNHGLLVTVQPPRCMVRVVCSPGLCEQEAARSSAWPVGSGAALTLHTCQSEPPFLPDPHPQSHCLCILGTEQKVRGTLSWCYIDSNREDLGLKGHRWAFLSPKQEPCQNSSGYRKKLKGSFCFKTEMESSLCLHFMNRWSH